MSIKELPQWFGLEIAQIVVDECLPSERTNGKAKLCRSSSSVTVLGIVVPGRKQAIKDGV